MAPLDHHGTPGFDAARTRHRSDSVSGWTGEVLAGVGTSGRAALNVVLERPPSAPVNLDAIGSA
jgi:hypothetical protein